MSPDPEAPSVSPVAPPPIPARPTALDRWRAALQVFVVTLGLGLLAEAAVYALLGPRGSFLDLGSGGFSALLILQNGLALLLIAIFLRPPGSSSPETLGFRHRPVRGEAALGLALFPPVLIGAALLQAGITRFLPALHTVPDNPLLALIESPGDLAAFLALSVLAGGIGEETIRAFVLRRFETYFGGMGWGLGVWSVLFGLLHVIQGVDKAIVVGLLGLAFGGIYAWRRSPVAPIVLHALFDVFQTIVAYVARQA
jgi:membrane protease YdiL (CAAX protease family)